MNRSLLAGAAIAAVLASAAAGYRIGTGQWPRLTTVIAVPGSPASVATADRKVLYWKHPDGAAEYSPTSGKTGKPTWPRSTT